MLAHLKRPAIFAHRGASNYAPENTLSAFRLAIEQDADVIELDVKLSADQHPVIMHDKTVDRTTNGTGLVSRLTLSELQSLDAGSSFGREFKNERIPTLRDVFDRLDGKVYINIELTNYGSPMDALPDQVARLVKEYNLHHRILCSSFNPFALIRLKRILPAVPLGLLALRGIKGRWAWTWMGMLIPHQALHLDYRDTTAQIVTRMQQCGRRIHPYTVNHESDIRNIIGLEVDGLFTDDVPLVKQIRQEVNRPIL